MIDARFLLAAFSRQLSAFSKNNPNGQVLLSAKIAGLQQVNVTSRERAES
jgi:hypothetical protein